MTTRHRDSAFSPLAQVGKCLVIIESPNANRLEQSELTSSFVKVSFAQNESCYGVRRTLVPSNLSSERVQPSRFDYFLLFEHQSGPRQKIAYLPCFAIADFTRLPMEDDQLEFAERFSTIRVVFSSNNKGVNTAQSPALHRQNGQGLWYPSESALVRRTPQQIGTD